MAFFSFFSTDPNKSGKTVSFFPSKRNVAMCGLTVADLMRLSDTDLLLTSRPLKGDSTNERLHYRPRYYHKHLVA